MGGLLIRLLQAARNDNTGRYAKTARKLLAEDVVERPQHTLP